MDIRFKLKMIINCVDKINLKIREYMYIDSLEMDVSVVYDVKKILNAEQMEVNFKNV